MRRSHQVHDDFFRAHPQKLELEKSLKAAKGDSYTQLTYDELKWFEQKGCDWRKGERRGFTWRALSRAVLVVSRILCTL
jgi:hypothetical protein